MNKYKIRPVNQKDTPWVAALLKEWWAGPLIITRGKTHQADELPGFIAEEKGKAIGLITYEISGNTAEIVSMNSLAEGKGVGSALVEAVKSICVKGGCLRLWLVTSNDNTRALRFWQKRGFRLAAVYTGAIDRTRKLKPDIPLTGNDGIPIRDEIELEMILGE
jgi:N-acetylglutamate synthase-like GNAT family acetyltransferase